MYKLFVFILKGKIFFSLYNNHSIYCSYFQKKIKKEGKCEKREKGKMYEEKRKKGKRKKGEKRKKGKIG
jgi:hypothetical protein